MIPKYQTLYFVEGNKEFNRSWQPSFEYRYQLYSKARAICEKLGLGFSCEGGFYELWIDDWADVENPYRYPTGYNLWKSLRDRNGEPMHLDEMCDEIKHKFPVVSKQYLLTLGKLWVDKTLFTDLPNIEPVIVNGKQAYRYKV